MMAVITVSRQLGSLGDEVAEAIAKLLNYRLVSRQLINQAAKRAGVPEVALATIDDLGLLGIRPPPRARKAYQEAVAQIMHELAAEGDIVIVGRAGQVILRDHPQAFHIKVLAPASLRAQRISQEKDIPFEAACAQINASDRYRRNYLQRTYHARWDDPELYDLIINTARLTPGEAASIVLHALRSRSL